MSKDKYARLLAAVPLSKLFKCLFKNYANDEMTVILTHRGRQQKLCSSENLYTLIMIGMK